MPGTQPLVSVVIPTHKRSRELRRCLRALARQTYPHAAFEIVVVEDGEANGAGEVVVATLKETDVDIRYTAVPWGGPAAARNAGWQLTRGEIVAFTDDDAVPHPRWIEEALVSFASGADAVSGRTVVPLRRHPTDYERNTSNLGRAPFVTCNAFCRRAVLERVQGFDTRFKRAWREDSDLQFALLDVGARIVRNERAIVYHPVRPGGRFMSIRQQRNQFYDALLYRKHPFWFRVFIRARPPWAYYAITSAQLIAVCAALAGRRRAAVGASAVWLSLVVRLLLHRLRGCRRDPSHIAEMAITSVLIPPIAVYWRLRGAWAFRVPFL